EPPVIAARRAMKLSTSMSSFRPSSSSAIGGRVRGTMNIVAKTTTVANAASSPTMKQKAIALMIGGKAAASTIPGAGFGAGSRRGGGGGAGGAGPHRRRRRRPAHERQNFPRLEADQRDDKQQHDGWDEQRRSYRRQRRQHDPDQNTARQHRAGMAAKKSERA